MSRSLFRATLVVLRGPRILLIGAPGVGKGTYASRACTDYNLAHVAAGDLIRAEIKERTPLGKSIKALVDDGKLVSDSIVIDLVMNHVRPLIAKGQGVIFDGFPRTAVQAELFSKEITLDGVIELTQPAAIIIEKISKRRVCESCGWTCNLADIYHAETGIRLTPLNPKVEGVCDKCNGKLVQRADDVESTVRDRLATYTTQTRPLVAWYQSKDAGLVHDFPVLGGVKEFYPKFKTVMDKIIAKVQ